MEKAFLGANTSNGFVNLYTNILECKKGNRLYILKGGSGVGKSTFLKSVRSYVEEKGYKTKSFYCTSDVNSLDGLLVYGLNIALVDGTSPHSIDTRIYGMFDKIINLGDGIIPSQDKLEEVNKILKEKKDFYTTAYAYIKSASILYEDIKKNYIDSIDHFKFKEMKEDVLKYFKEEKKEIGKKEKMYISAFTGSGYKDYTESLIEDKKIIFLENGFDSVGSLLLEEISKELIRKGFDVIEYLNLFEDRPIAIEIKDKDIVILISSFLNKKEYNGDITFNVDNILCLDRLNRVSNLDKVKCIKRLLTSCFLNMENALSRHTLIEKYYYSKIDFNIIDNLLKEFLKEIDVLINEK